jgi:hypothetical protein
VTDKSNAELAAQASRLRDEAAELLEGGGLMAIVRSVGPAAVIGSYALDLMTWRDIDVNVRLPDERDVANFFRIGDAISNRFETVRAFYSNMFLRTDQEFESGLYWGIRLLHRGQAWKVDLWGYGEQEYAEKMRVFEKLRRRLEGADRYAALRVKDAVCQWEQYRSGVYSVHVYEAVARDGVTTVDEFQDWLRERVPEALAESDQG